VAVVLSKNIDLARKKGKTSPNRARVYVKRNTSNVCLSHQLYVPRPWPRHGCVDVPRVTTCVTLPHLGSVSLYVYPQLSHIGSQQFPDSYTAGTESLAGIRLPREVTLGREAATKEERQPEVSEKHSAGPPV
jgi:hypothetical protein